MPLGIPNGEAALWKIERAAVVPPSYLFGTIHVSDHRVLRRLSAKVSARAIHSSRHGCGRGRRNVAIDLEVDTADGHSEPDALHVYSERTTSLTKSFPRDELRHHQQGDAQIDRTFRNRPRELLQTVVRQLAACRLLQCERLSSASEGVFRTRSGRRGYEALNRGIEAGRPRNDRTSSSMLCRTLPETTVQIGILRIVNCLSPGRWKTISKRMIQLLSRPSAD